MADSNNNRYRVTIQLKDRAPMVLYMKRGTTKSPKEFAGNIMDVISQVEMAAFGYAATIDALEDTGQLIFAIREFVYLVVD